ncbi:MAG: ABC-type transporter, integral rane subunit [Microbacteriaceae bacterium]|jgi:putative spermidine/putrescine transport system permease protein|nr:ABC-type transporter, integral rane subunit [Microbacteriaceae bacterium]
MNRGMMRRISVYNYVISVFMLVPLVIVVAVSFNPGEYSIFPPDGFSTHWYSEAFSNQQFIGALWLSIEIGVVATAISVVLGTLAAFGLRRAGTMRVRLFATTLAISPATIPEVLLGLGLFIYFGNIIPIGLGMGATILGHVLVCMPVVFQVMSSSLSQLDTSLHEAATMLGASPPRVFVHVTAPMLMPGLFGASLLSFVFSFDNVNISLFLSAPGQAPLPVQMYSYLDFRSDPTVAAMSSALVAIGVIIFVIANKLGALKFMGTGTTR